MLTRNFPFLEVRASATGQSGVILSTLGTCESACLCFWVNTHRSKLTIQSTTFSRLGSFSTHIGPLTPCVRSRWKRNAYITNPSDTESAASQCVQNTHSDLTGKIPMKTKSPLTQRCEWKHLNACGWFGKNRHLSRRGVNGNSESLGSMRCHWSPLTQRCEWKLFCHALLLPSVSSPLTQRCEWKLQFFQILCLIYVTSHAEVWMETSNYRLYHYTSSVTSHAEVWMETNLPYYNRKINRSPLTQRWE